MELKIHNLEGLMRRMDALAYNLQKNIIARALRQGSQPIQADAAGRAPDDPLTAGSRIAESMTVQVSGQTSDGAVAKIGPGMKGGGWVGKFAERGTKYQRKTPFLGPAFQAQQDEAVDLVGKVLAEEIEKGLKGP